MDNLNVNTLGKRLAHALRHAPEEYNLTMDPYGVVPLSEIFSNLGYTQEELEFVVNNDSKTRFKFALTVNNELGVKASQGHSITVFTEELPLSVSQGFHGTLLKNADSIRRSGLRRMKREFVHVSKTIATAREVGLRWKFGDVIIFKIDLAGLQKSGVKVFESANGVVLAKSIPKEFCEELEIIKR